MPERYLGRTLGKYRIDALLGSGGFAWVYKAWDPELEIPVALKILKPQYAGDDKFEQRFRREASTAAKLRHPNIVKIFAVGKEQDAVFFAMDYLPHGLADRLEVMTTFPEAMLIRVGIDVASALGFAHRENVIHRDIKVDNILFDEHGNAIVADFGIARAVSNYAEQTGTNMVVGTPQYFSPEQARGLALDGRADIYSLGVTLYKTATGQLPFNGEDWYEIARQHVEDKPAKPRSINPALSREMERIILCCLEKDPADRFQTGEQLVQALAILLQDRGETVTSARTLAVPAMDTSPSPHRAVSRIRRRVRRVGGRLALGGAAVALLVGWLMFRDKGGEASAAGTRATGTGATAAGRGGNPALATRGGDSGANAARPRVLTINAPPNAEVKINGVAVGKGSWRADTLPPGMYTVVAAVATSPGCPSTTETKTVELGSDSSRSVRMTPRGCGRIVINTEPRQAAYTIKSFSGYQTLKGSTASRTPVVVPVGLYRVMVNKAYCAPYDNEEVRVTEGVTTSVRVLLICEKTR